MYILAKKRKSSILKSRALQWDALNKISQLKTDSADTLLEKATDLLDTVQFNYDYARIKSLKERILKIKGDYHNSYKLSVDLVEYYKKIGDQRNVAMTYMQIGNCLYFLKDYEKAKKTWKKLI